MKSISRLFSILTASLTLLTLTVPMNGADYSVRLRDRSKEGVAREYVEQWNPKETAIIVCDMWSSHPCAHAVARLQDLAVEMNKVFADARAKGITIVFAPSSFDMDKWYADLPARKTSAKYRHGYGNARHWDFWWHGRGGHVHHSHLAFPGEKDAVGWPPPGGANCIVKSKPSPVPLPPQTPILKIEDTDILTDDFVEMVGGKVDGKEYKESLFKERGIKNVILCGVHTDMCVIGRPFGCRALKVLGYNVVLARDLTDHTWHCDSRNKNAPDHYQGLDVIVNYIETYICPSVTSTDITGRPAFKFDPTRYENLTAEEEKAKKEVAAEKGKYKVEIVKAFYGKSETEGADVTEKVKKAFNGTRFIPISDFNGALGDPNHGVFKYLYITYKIDGVQKNQKFPENDTILLEK